MNTDELDSVLFEAERRVLKIQTKLYQGSVRPTWGLWRARCGEQGSRHPQRLRHRGLTPLSVNLG